MLKKGYHRNVILTGLTSFFTDVSSEMIYPLFQAFMSLVMTTQKAMLGPALGIIEGVAESTASLLKVFAGYYSDRMQKRKMPTIAGYGLSAVSKLILVAAAWGWGMVLLARFIDRIGKGIRTAPRDALIAESTPPELQGKSFGFQRGMDFMGAFLGSIVALLLVRRFLDPITGNLSTLNAFYTLFLISIVPAFLGVACLFFVREPHHPLSVNSKPKPKPNLNFRHYDPNLQVFFLAQLVFTLGNSSNQFLLLRSMNLGFALSTVIMMYILFNLASSLLSPVFGSLSDRIGRKKLLIAGYTVYGVIYLSFGLITPSSKNLLWVFWIIYGIYYAMTEGVEKAYISDLAPKDSRATALGFYHTIVGIGLLPASLIAGALFAAWPGLPFVFGSVMAAITVIILLFWMRPNQIPIT